MISNTPYIRYQQDDQRNEVNVSLGRSIDYRYFKAFLSSGVYFILFLFVSNLYSQVPVITTRFANPSYSCANEYCLDVEFRANVPNVQIFGVNVRFFYPDSILELIGFSDFQGGYGAVAPDPPIVLSNGPLGPAWFNFNGPADWVSGAVQLQNTGIVTYLDVVNWTKLFQVCFQIDDPNPNLTGFCVPVVWDLEQDINNGGYIAGDDGVVITVVDPFNSNLTSPAVTNVEQFNWMYNGDGSPPYGMPVNTNCISLTPDCYAYITCPLDRILECGELTDPTNTGYATSSDNCIGDPVITFTDSLISGPCNQQYSILRRWITTNACNFSDTCFQTISIVDTIPPIITCPSNITVLCSEIPIFATPIVTDVCDPSVIITFTESTTSGPCAAQHVLTRTWIATDHCGNSSTCLSTATYTDNLAPLITCPGNVTINCQEDNSSANTGSATATDNCSSVMITQSQSTTQSPDQDACGHYTYTISRNWIATDACGNSSSCLQTINVRDITAPSISCPNDITVLFPASTLPANTGIPSGLDNCDSGLTMNYTDALSNENCPSINTVTRTWKATDACGNSATCIQHIVIDDRGSICGSVHDDLGQPIAGVEIRLIADVNSNQVFDGGDILITTVYSNVGTGEFCFNQIRPCAYILLEIQPASYGNLSDYDTSPDPDGNDSADGPDNEIPVTLSAGENDADNQFIDIICPTQLPVIPADTICENGSVVFQISAIPLGSLTYSWNFGSGSNPGTGSGLGPHTISYITTTDNQANGAVVSMNIGKPGCVDLTGPVSQVKINPYPNASISRIHPDSCYYSVNTFKPVAPIIPGATYSWTFGANAVPSSATGYGPHMVYYTDDSIKTVKLIILPNTPGSQCPSSDSITFEIFPCVANIAGVVRSTSGTGIQGVNVRLYSDNNLDGMQDNNVIVKSVFTNFGGEYLMTSLTPGNYVLVEVQPNNWFSVDDFDSSDDGDLVPNSNPIDNIIPVTLLPMEFDIDNIFVEGATPGSITGSVFVDTNGNEVPNTGEGLAGVTLSIFNDNNVDGRADSPVPVMTQVTSSTGFYSFSSVPIGNYVLGETQPSNYFSIKDFDATNDLDLVPNTNVHNDTIPVTITNGETDAQNYFIEGPCNLLVTSTLDWSVGCLRGAIYCAQDGDTIRFANSLSGSTINITTSRIEISKHITILSDLAPRVTISSQIAGLFKILNNVEFKKIDIISGLTLAGNMGAAFENLGMLRLNEVNILRNPLLPAGQFLIRNTSNSNLELSGNCQIQMN